MKLKISDDGIESVISFNSISNGRTTERDPEKMFSEVMEDINRTMIKLTLKKSTGNKSTTNHMESLDKWLEYDKQLKIERDWPKPPDSYNFNHFDHGVQHVPTHNTRLDNFDFKPYLPTPAPPSARTGALAFRALAGAVGGILLLILLANICKKKGGRTRRGVVHAPRAALGARTVQPDIGTRRRPPGQGGFPPQLVICQPSDTPNLDLPPSYSECITKNVTAPPPYTNPADTAPLVHNRRVEIGFRNDEIGFKNDCVAMTTSPKNYEGLKTELVFDNGRIVERLSLDLNKETGQATWLADVKDRVVYVDEKSTPLRR